MVIGLTGSIACGKSLISRYLENKGYNYISYFTSTVYPRQQNAQRYRTY